MFLVPQGRYTAAVSLCERSQAIREKVFEPDHLEVAQSLNTWAGLLTKLVNMLKGNISDKRLV